MNIYILEHISYVYIPDYFIHFCVPSASTHFSPWIRERYIKRRKLSLIEASPTEDSESYKGLSCWRLLWTLMGTTSWHIWQERNRRWQLNESKPQDQITKEIIKTVHICFDVKSNPSDRGLLEINAIKHGKIILRGYCPTVLLGHNC